MIKMNMSMTERIKAGKLFTDMCEGLPEKRLRGKTLMYEFNHSHPAEVEKRESLIKKMFATVGENAWVEPPVYFSYGCIDSREVRKKPGGHWIIRDLTGLDLVGLASL